MAKKTHPTTRSLTARFERLRFLVEPWLSGFLDFAFNFSFEDEDDGADCEKAAANRWSGR